MIFSPVSYGHPFCKNYGSPEPARTNQCSKTQLVFSTAFQKDYLPRNSTATGFFAFAWDGTRQHNNGKGNDKVKVVPNGAYILKMSVLKALGDATNPAHWETFTSSVITIARP